MTLVRLKEGTRLVSSRRPLVVNQSGVAVDFAVPMGKVGVAVGVSVTVGVLVGVSVGVSVALGVGVSVPVGVSVAVGVIVGVAVGQSGTAQANGVVVASAPPSAPNSSAIMEPSAARLVTSTDPCGSSASAPRAARPVL